jgi:ribonuclease D
MAESPALVTTAAGLRAALEPLHDGDWVAVDTEFVRETTYWPRVCLVQLANDDTLVLVDPLALDDLEPLFALMRDRSVTKVFHAASQDLEIFHHLDGTVPDPVFDTQLAAPLLGFPEQAGFARLVEALLGVQLSKGHARTDWTERPLPAEALEYAADDVRYLVPLYHAIHGALVERGRLEWLGDELARLTDPARFERPPADAWRRLKGIDRLPPPGRAVAQALAEWREEQARGANVPRGRVLKDDALVDIARALPRNPGQLRRLRSVRGAGLERHGDRVLQLVADARERPAPDPGGQGERPAPLDATQEAVVDVLGAVIRLEAARHDLNPATLADRKTLARIAAGEPPPEVLTGWRRAVVGEVLEGIVDGSIRLRCEGGRVRLEEVAGDREPAASGGTEPSGPRK